MIRDIYSPATIEGARGAGAALPAASRPVGFIESIGLGDRRDAAQEDWGWNQINYRGRALAEVRAALQGRNALPARRIGAADPRTAPLTGEYDAEIADLFAAARRIRDSEPDFLADYAEVTDRASLDAMVHRLRAADLHDVDDEAGDASGVGMFIGQVFGRIRRLDPTNFIPVPGAGPGASVARQILVTAGREAAANVAITAVTEPFVQSDAANIGVDRGFGDFVTDVAVAGVGGALIGGGAAAIGPGAAAVRDAVTPFDRRVARELRRAEIDGEAHMDVAIARAFARAVPPERRTPDQQAALHVLTREAEIRQASPFLPGPDGDDAHVEWLDVAMRGMTGAGPPLPAAAPRPIRQGDVAAGTADMSRVRRRAREELKARIRQAESGGDDAARNPRSSATGRYQFTSGTWLSYYRRRYGTRDSDAAALARRGDPAIQEVLMNDLTADNAAALRDAGLPETAGSLYLLHFAGSGGGVAVLRAAPDTPVIRLLGADAVRANPFLRGMNAGDLIAWADRRMGQSGETPAGAGIDAGGEAPIPDPVMADIRFSPIDAERALGFAEGPQLRTDFFASAEEHARAQLRFEGSRDALEGFATVRPDRDIAFDPYDFLDPMRAYAEARRPLRPEDIAAALRITPEEARQVAQLAANSSDATITVASNGRIQYKPRPPERSPASLLDFISARGGIEDIGGELAQMGAADWHRQAPFRKRLVRERSASAVRGQAESPRHDPDAIMEAAVEAGYFPEFKAAFDAGEELDFSTADLLDAIDRELRGQPRYVVDDYDAAQQAAMRAKWGDGPGEIMDGLETLARAEGFDLDIDTRQEALARVLDGADEAEALADAMTAAAFRDLDQAALETGRIDYAIDDTGRRWEDDINFDDPGEAGPIDPATPAGAGRSGGEPGAARQAGAIDAQHAGDPEAGGFDDALGEGAQRQLDSLEHDIRMLAASGEDLGTIRLSPEGEEIPIADLLRELDAEARAIDEMRACMTPGGGGE